jgi:NDP-sugar pyrophosphorylase family protein
MQAVFICGGRGTRLRPRHGPKSLAPIGGSTLLAWLVSHIGRFHVSPKPPVVIVDAEDQDTPEALVDLLPGARVVHQPQPDGVANALLLAQPLLDEGAIVTLGDLFLDGTFAGHLRRRRSSRSTTREEAVPSHAAHATLQAPVRRQRE